MTAGSLIPLRSQGGPHVVEAWVSRRAAALRSLRVDGIDIVEPTTTFEGTPGMAGVVLAPWPNRVEGASWRLDGVCHELDVTEPELGNANHGLLSNRRFDVVRHEGSSVTLGADIAQEPGYPFVVRVEVTYQIVAAGLRVGLVAHNLGSVAAPIAAGAHPYLRVGDTRIEDLLVTVDADHCWPLDDRHLPGRRQRLGAPLNRAPLERCPGHATFERSTAVGPLTHVIAAPDGRAVVLTADPEHRFTQLWVAPDLPTDGGTRRAIAIEPMTAPPNALRHGTGLAWVAPGSPWSSGWSLELRGAG